VNSEELTRHYYSKLKGLPDFKKIAVFSILEYALIIGRSLETSLLTLLYAFILYFSLISIMFLKKFKTAMFLGDVTALPYLILSFFSFSIFAFGFTLPILSFSMLLRYGEKKSLLFSLLISLLPIVFFPKEVVIYLIYLATVSFLYYLYLWSINKKGKDIVGITSLTILRPFMKAVMEKDSKPLDNFFEKTSEEKEIHIALIRLDDKILVIPQIHFGIFGNQGSARLPYKIEGEIKDAMVFHGPGSHEINLATAKESDRIASILKGRIEDEKEWQEAVFNGITFHNIGNFQATRLDFSKFSISFLERPNFGIDDLPEQLWEDIIKYNNFVVDTHNTFLSRDFDKIEIEDLKEFLREKRQGTSQKKLYIGYAESLLPNNCDGYCNKRIRTFVISDGEKKIAIVYFYANNSERETRDIIAKSGEGLVDRTIMVTPDDHSCAGSSMVATYLPARPCDNMYNIVRKTIEDALSSVKEVSRISFMVVKLRAKMIGKIISSMLEGLEKVGNFVSRTFWVPLALPYFIFALFLYFLN
jgi:putative membrane protein